MDRRVLSELVGTTLKGLSITEQWNVRVELLMGHIDGHGKLVSSIRQQEPPLLQSLARQPLSQPHLPQRIRK